MGVASSKWWAPVLSYFIGSQCLILFIVMDQCFEQFSMECRKINQAITLVVVSPRFENVLVVQLHGE